MGDACPKLLEFMERDWVARDSGGGGGGGGSGLAVMQEEKKLELKLGPPVAEDWVSSSSSTSTTSVDRKAEDPSPLSLGYIPKSSAPTKRGFSDTVEPKSQPLHAAAASVNAAAINSNTSQKPRTASVPPVVGWPPIRSFRKNIASSSSKPPAVAPQTGAKTGGKPEIHNKGNLVKINMDGILIGRKVDLKAYDSYEKLSSAVGELFRGLLAAQKDPSTARGAQVADEQKQAFTGLLDGTGEYILVYEDNEGDRILVGDVPWEMFVSTAKRLRVLKSSELSTMALGAVSRKRTATEC